MNLKHRNRPLPDLRSESGQAGLLSLLAAVVVIGLLVWIFFFRGTGAKNTERTLATDAIVHSNKQTIPGAAMDQATAVTCKNNLSQLRQAIMMDSDPTEGTPPPSLQSLTGIPAEMKVCPASGRPYAYDPRTGRVSCLTPGHQGL